MKHQVLAFFIRILICPSYIPVLIQITSQMFVDTIHYYVKFRYYTRIIVYYY